MENNTTALDGEFYAVAVNIDSTETLKNLVDTFDNGLFERKAIATQLLALREIKLRERIHQLEAEVERLNWLATMVENHPETIA